MTERTDAQLPLPDEREETTLAAGWMLPACLAVEFSECVRDVAATLDDGLVKSHWASLVENWKSAWLEAGTFCAHSLLPQIAALSREALRQALTPSPYALRLAIIAMNRVPRMDVHRDAVRGRKARIHVGVNWELPEAETEALRSCDYLTWIKKLSARLSVRRAVDNGPVAKSDERISVGESRTIVLELERVACGEPLRVELLRKPLGVIAEQDFS